MPRKVKILLTGLDNAGKLILNYKLVDELDINGQSYYSRSYKINLNQSCPIH